MSEKNFLLNKARFAILWNSPTFTTWGSLATRAASVGLIMPLVLIKFSTAEIAVWYLFLTIMGLQLLMDIGFGVTFSRVIAYAVGGAKTIGDLRKTPQNNTLGKINNPLLMGIFATMERVYLYIGFAWLTLLVVFGTLTLVRPISQVDNMKMAWFAWALVIIGSSIRIYGTQYVSYLMGVNQIALLRRYETLFWILTIIGNFLVLIFDGSIFSLMFSTNLFIVLNCVFNRFLTLKNAQQISIDLRKTKFDKNIFKKVWPSAWRSGLSGVLSRGLIQATGLFYAQVGTTDKIASYLFALNLIRILTQFCQTPFYTKLPLLARLQAEGASEKQRLIAEEGMRTSYFLLALSIIVIGFAIVPILDILKSNVQFVELNHWFLLGISAFFNRYGAMHLQLYSTTNHIVTHIADGITGIIFLMAVFLLIERYDLYAFPISQLISCLMFYSWYGAVYSYKTFHFKFWRFEYRTSIIPLMLLLFFWVIKNL